MARKQTRRTISFNQLLLHRIAEEAALDKKSTSNWVAELVIAELAKRGKPFTEPLTYTPPEIVARAREKRAERYRYRISKNKVAA